MFVNTGGTGSCQNDKPWGSHWLTSDDNVGIIITLQFAVMHPNEP